MRSGKWKYILEGKNESLFDLSVDEREQADFAKERPEIVGRLRSLFGEWESGVMKYPPES